MSENKKERYSYSKLGTYHNCPFSYKLIYQDHVKRTNGCYGLCGSLLHSIMESLEHGEVTKEEALYRWHTEIDILEFADELNFPTENAKNNYIKDVELYLEYFEPCDEIWHAGDIGSLEVAKRLAAFRPFRAVYGNIDGQEIRKLYPQINRFTVDGAEVLIKHIGGYPGKYDPSIIGSLMTRPPKLFISGHSHILKVKYDKTLDMLHINPGAAGMSGFHKVRTLVRFVINQGAFQDLEVIELADK